MQSAPVQSAAGITGYQGWGSGQEGQGEDDGIGYELQLVGFGFGAGWIPELDGAIVCPRSEPPVGEHRQGVQRGSMAAELSQQSLAGLKGRQRPIGMVCGYHLYAGDFQH